MVSASDGEYIGVPTRYTIPWLWAIIGALCLLKKNKGGCLNSLWMSIMDIQFIRWVALVDLGQSDFYNRFFVEVFKIFNEFNLLSNFEETKSQVGDSRFVVFGLESNYFLSNAEEMMLFWLFCAVSFGLFASLKCCCKNNQVYQTILKYLKYSALIRPFVVGFQDLVAFCVLQMYDLEFTDSYSTASVVTSMVVGVCLLGFFVWLPLAIWRAHRSSQEDAFSNIVTLVEEFEESNSVYSYLFYPLSLAKRGVSAVLIITLRSSPGIQIVGIGVLSLAETVFVILLRPFNSRAGNWVGAIQQLTELSLVISVGMYSYSSNILLDLGTVALFYLSFLLSILKLVFCLSAPESKVTNENSQSDKDLYEDTNEIEKSQLPHQYYHKGSKNTSAEQPNNPSKFVRKSQLPYQFYNSQNQTNSSLSQS